MNRRGFLTGGASLLLAAPAVIRIPDLLMPIKAPIITKAAIQWPMEFPPGIYNMAIKEVFPILFKEGLKLTFVEAKSDQVLTMRVRP